LNNLKTILKILRGESYQSIPDDVPMTSEAREALNKKLNYWVDYKVLRAGDFGVPQNRERIFIVAFNKDKFPNVNFLVANYKEIQRQYCVQEYEKLQQTLPISFFVGKTPEIIEVADCSVMVSGSVSLEMLERRTPFVAIYRSSWATYFIGCVIITCKYWSLPNLMAGRKIMPERFSVGNPTPAIDAVVTDMSQWLEHPESLAEAVGELDKLRHQVHSTGATRRTAEVILGWLDRSLEKGTVAKAA
jgi:lipid A disaccharide synthetase